MWAWSGFKLTTGDVGLSKAHANGDEAETQTHILRLGLNVEIPH